MFLMFCLFCFFFFFLSPFLYGRNRNIANKAEIERLQEEIIGNSHVIDEQQDAVKGLEGSEAQETENLEVIQAAKANLVEERERLRPLCQAPEIITLESVGTLQALYHLQTRLNNWQPVEVSDDQLEFEFGDKWLVGVKIVPNEDLSSQEYTVISKISSLPTVTSVGKRIKQVSNKPPFTFLSFSFSFFFSLFFFFFLLLFLFLLTHHFSPSFHYYD